MFWKESRKGEEEESWREGRCGGNEERRGKLVYALEAGGRRRKRKEGKLRERKGGEEA